MGTADGDQGKPMPSPADLCRLMLPGWVEATTGPVPRRRYVRPLEVDELLSWVPPVL